MGNYVDLSGSCYTFLYPSSSQFPAAQRDCIRIRVEGPIEPLSAPVEVGAALGVVPLGAGVTGAAVWVWAVGRVAAENRCGAGNGHPGHNLRGEHADSSFHNLG